MRPSKVLISILILLAIGLHALPVLSYQGLRQTRWPFLGWAMYARSYPPGPVQITTRRLIATTAGGSEEEVTPALVGLSRSAYRNTYLVPLREGDSTAAHELLARLNRARDDRLVGVRLVGQQHTLADTGVVNEPLPVVTYQADPSASK